MFLCLLLLVVQLGYMKENRVELNSYKSSKTKLVHSTLTKYLFFTGAAYGDGVYFAKDAYYSLSYSQQGPNGDRYMYLARVLVGKYTTGKQRLKKPPAKDPSKPEILFDSLVNREENPTIFVVFNDFHVYPKYLISFK